MTTFLCKTCNKHRPIDKKVMVKKPNGLLQAKCRDCVAKTMQPTPVTWNKPQHLDHVQLTLVQAEAIKVAIKAKYETAIKFCAEHKIAYSGFMDALRCARRINPKTLETVKKVLGMTW